MPDPTSQIPRETDAERWPEPGHAPDARRERERLELLGRVCIGLAHDFNNLLSILTGNLEVALEEEPERAPLRESLNAALDAAWAGAELSRLTLELARPEPEAAEAPRAVRPIRLLDLAPDLERAVRMALGSRVSLRAEVTRPEARVAVTRSRLIAAVLVLALHVGEATPSGTQLTLRVEGADEVDGERVRIGLYVTRPGAGAAPHARLPLTLGLAESLAAEHGGRVETSGAGAAAWARLVLPATPS